MSASTKLPSLLATVLTLLERTYVEEGAGRNGMPSLDLWSNLLRALGKDGIDHRELPTIVRLSKRALRIRISAATRRGWVEEQKSGRGQVAVQLTVSGHTAATRWKMLQSIAEALWRKKVGITLADKLRASLEAVVSELPLEYPHYPASYGAADATITGGNGKDWKAVCRQGGDTVSTLPLSSLVSQALVAFARDYEEKSPVALSLSTTVIRRISPKGYPLRELGNSVGISALLRHGFLRVGGSSVNEIVYLTSKGSAVSFAYEARLISVEAEWCKRFGASSVTTLLQALEDVANISAHIGSAAS